MKRYRYAEWDGRQAFADIEADDVLDEAMDVLHQRARGLNPSLDDFLKRFGQYFPNLEQAELDALMQGLQAQTRQMQELLAAMPDDMREALAQLLQQKFSDPRLQRQLAQLAQQWERFFELAQHGFHGTDPLSIEEGLRMADRFDLIGQLEQTLRRLPHEDRLAEIDMEQVRDLLGEEAHERIQRLKELIGLLEKAGYVHRVGDRFELTPRGIRKLGERALRHIFSVLEQGQFGPHETSFHGHS